MAFQEKSAWIMSVALVLGGFYYFGVVAEMSSGITDLAPPVVPVLVTYTVLLIVVAIVGHIAIAVFSPKEGDAPLDERERQIFNRAGNISGYVLGAGVISTLGHYLIFYDGHALFYGIFASLMLSQLADYVIRIVLYRTAT
jgi:hypothetical protein